MESVGEASNRREFQGPRSRSRTSACPRECSKSGLGRPSVGGQRTNWRAPPRCAVVVHGPRPSRMHSRERHYVLRTTSNTAEGLNGNALVWPVGPVREEGTYMRQPFKSLALCSTAPSSGKAGQGPASVPRRLGGFGIKPVRRSGVAWWPEQSFIAAWPNPSIEGTSTSGLRPLAAAPHVKR